ncbi:MAG TPA: hypothetical protein VG826_34965 [Pirellulales bacterium]|nr:hypothetical protein [Pirellulales bacterium]
MTAEEEDNPYRSPSMSSGVATPFAHPPVTLVERSWWRREFRVETRVRPVTVVYNGRGVGHEEVLVDGKVAVRKRSWIWFVPHFDFEVDGHSATVDVAVWPWFRISSFRFVIDGHPAYEEVTQATWDKAALTVVACLLALLGTVVGLWYLFVEHAR